MQPTLVRLTPAVRRLTVMTVLAVLAVGCEYMPWNKSDSRSDESAKRIRPESEGMAQAGTEKTKSAIAQVRPSKAATTQPTLNNVTGTVTFAPAGPDTVTVVVELRGLQPNGTHGFHIHEKGDLSDPGLMSTGAHFNPSGHKHGGPESPLSHAGDLGNVKADADGNVKTQMTARGVSLDDASHNSIVGRSVIVHAKEDDLKTDPAGNAGARVAGGVIEMAK